MGDGRVTSRRLSPSGQPASRAALRGVLARGAELDHDPRDARGECDHAHDEDDEADQSASVDAFAMLHAALRFRLRRGRLSVLDATNVEEWSRRELLDIAARERRPAVAIVLDLSMEVCLERLSRRGVRPVPAQAVRRQQRELHRSLPLLLRALRSDHELANRPAA